MTSVRALRLAICLSLVAVASVTAQRSQAPQLPEAFNEPIQLFTVGLGPFTRTISSSNPEAQAYFNQGMQMMYAFAKQDATRSFRESWTKDPNCAICYWAEAWSWGSYLNGPMSAREAPFAYAAMQKAIELREQASPKEQAFIDALSVRYVENFDPATRREQDEAYAEAMRRLSEQYPDDLDAMTLYGEALFLLEPRRGVRDAENPSVQRLHQVLETVLEADIRHPGACHLYVHATESTVVPEKGEPCAEYLGNSIPGASHINHMPSHTWNRVGRWGDAVRANIQAWHSDMKAEVGEGFAIYPSHNLHMLLFAASMDGQGGIARFGRFDEIAAVTDRPASPVSAGMWDFAQGYAKLRADEIDFARMYLGRVREGAKAEASFRGHSAEHLLGTVGGMLEGEILRAEGKLADAIVVLQRAVELEDELVYDEPEPLPFSARHWLGAALIEAGRFAEAERVYEAALVDHPHNGWSLLGLQQALAGQGRSSDAVDADLAASWARSDTWIRSSRF
ncbi:MAG: tetratricopeptide repeat protein [Planctomycetota bacterium]|jgi:tetratricopeptide (TPR) repeat protein